MNATKAFYTIYGVEILSPQSMVRLIITHLRISTSKSDLQRPLKMHQHTTHFFILPVAIDTKCNYRKQNNNT